MRKIVIPVAAVLVLGVGTAVMARGVHRGSPGVTLTEGKSLLEGVLADLVEDGKISQEQSEAITAALAERRSQALEEAKAALDQLKAFWEDDVLTADEISRLPRSDRITDAEGPFADALEDGQITREELDEIRSEHSHGHRRFGHHRRGQMTPRAKQAGSV